MAKTVKLTLVVDSKGTVTGVKGAEGAFVRLDKQVEKSGKGLGRFNKILGAIAFAVVARKILDFTMKMRQLGFDIEETNSKFESTFEGALDQLGKFEKEFAHIAGLTKREFRDLASISGAIFQGAGLDAREAASETERALLLAGDIASRFNVDINEAFASIKSGLVGQNEPLQKYGILLNAAEVEAFALANRVKGATGELTDQEKVTARLTLAIQKAGKTNGDLYNTMESGANKARNANAILREQEDILATELAPAIEKVEARWQELLINNQSDTGRFLRFIGDLAFGFIVFLETVLSKGASFFDFLGIKVQKSMILIETAVSGVLSTLRDVVGGYAAVMRFLGKETEGAEEVIASLTSKIGFLGEVEKEREGRIAAARGAIEARSNAIRVDVDATDSSTQSTKDNTLSTNDNTTSTNQSTESKKKHKTAVEELAEDIAKLTLEVNELTAADFDSLVAMEQKRQALEERADSLRTLIELTAEWRRGEDIEFDATGSRDPKGLEPIAPEDPNALIPRMSKDLGLSPDQIDATLEKYKQYADAKQRVVDTNERLAESEEAAGKASIRNAVAIGASQKNLLKTTLTIVQQQIQAKMAESIANAIGHGSILGPIAGGIAGAAMAAIFSSLLGDTGFAPSGGGGGFSNPHAGPASSSASASLGGMYVPGRGVSTGSMSTPQGYGASQRMDVNVSLEHQVIDGDLFTIETRLSETRETRNRVGNAT